MSKFFMRMIVTLVISLGLLTSCSESIPQPRENMFEVGIEELVDVHVDRPFKVHGYLMNHAKNKWAITHGVDMFTYQIVDEKGDSVPHSGDFLFRNDTGMITEIKPNQVYTHNGEEQRSKEYYEFTIHKAGKYKVKAIVKFRITYEKIEYDFQKTSDFYEFIVK
ncbi:hypothetical protein I6N90_17745 [Paenibacillus sp. GSMTC-2017]|uniref:hypothetical protein n=1 Tax=Paenibacillus sp. GSMTC-2017 TaxID=2794350 RepID=UPI0018D72799|nr:hypothetical protein [Paenibacillus sp. GSMTC-2017]MBH5319642.1 hypothetical protein [Paenibacillus sp. GSMTC-2017]